VRPVDVIVCRNVLIYFSDSATLRAVRQFHDTLLPGGYLLLGHAESLSRISDMFQPIRFKGAMIYQKPEPKAVEGRV
jgi:chemotaxis protein methyltransferase CheR